MSDIAGFVPPLPSDPGAAGTEKYRKDCDINHSESRAMTDSCRIAQSAIGDTNGSAPAKPELV
jgi:hypothetical protein